MRYLSLSYILIVVLCAGCSMGKLSKQDTQNISSMSISINSTITTDVSGTRDSVDVPLNKDLSDKLLVLIKTTLEEKGFKIADHHISNGMAHSTEKYYAVMTESDRERSLSDLEVRRGPYYSDRLESKQLEVLYEDFEDNNDNPAIGKMGFKGDATLVVQVNGRVIGWGKAIGGFIANALLIPLELLARGGGHFGSSSNLVDIDETYRLRLRLYSTRNGDILWDDYINKRDSIDELLQDTEITLKRHIPSR